MRAKRKALHDKKARKSSSAKSIPLALTPTELNDGVKPEDFSRLENEGGIRTKTPLSLAQSVGESSEL